MVRRPLRLFFAALVVALLLCFGCGKSGKPTMRDVSSSNKAPDIPLYPNAKVLERTFAPDGSFQVRLSTTAAREDIVNFYLDALHQLGWRQDAEVHGAEQLFVFRQGSKSIYLSILPTENSDQVNVVLTDKE
jgi:hypothetical protein